jgi:hypothetical protein
MDEGESNGFISDEFAEADRSELSAMTALIFDDNRIGSGLPPTHQS